MASWREGFEVAKAAAADEIAARAAAELTIVEAGDRGRYDDARAWLRHAEAAAVGTESDDLRSLLLIARATLSMNTSRAEEAVADLEAALALERALDDPMGQLSVLSRLAYAHAELQHTDRVLELQHEYLRRAEALVGPRHPMLTSAMNSIAGAISHRGRHDEALAIYAEIEDIIRTQVGPDDARLVIVAQNVGLTLKEAKRYDEACAQIERALQMSARILGEDSPTRPSMFTVLGASHLGAGRPAEALRAYERAQAGLERIGAEHHASMVSAVQGQANALAALGRPAEGLQRLDAIRQSLERALGPDDPSVASAYRHIGDLHAEAGERIAATRAYESAIEISRAGAGDRDTLVTIEARFGLANVTIDDAPERAVAQARAALAAAREDHEGAPPHAHTELLLAKMLRRAAADPTEVRAHATAAVELLTALGVPERDALAEAEALAAD